MDGRRFAWRALAPLCLFLLAVPPAFAQTALEDADITAMGGQIAELQAKIADLEAKLENLKVKSLEVEGVMVARETSEGAEVSVGSGENQILMTVGAGGELSIGKDGGQQIALSVGEDQIDLLLGAPEGAGIHILQKDSGGEVAIKSDEGKVARMSLTDDGGEVILQDGGHTITLSLRSGGSELTLLKDGKTISLKETGDGGSLAFGPSGGASVTLVAAGDGGSLTIGKSGGKNAKLSQEGGSPTLSLGTGSNPEVKLTNVGSGGELSFGGQSTKAKLSSNESGGTLELGDPAAARVRLGTPDGDPIVEVGNAENRTVLHAGAESTGLEVKSAPGVAQVGNFESKWGLALSNGGNPQILVGQEGATHNTVNIYEGGNEPKVTLRAGTDGGDLFIGEGLGNAPVVLSTEAGDAKLYLGTESGKHIELKHEGSDDSVSLIGTSNVIRMVSEGSDIGVKVESSFGHLDTGVFNGQWGYNLEDSQGQLIAGLGHTAGKAMALRLYDDGALIAAVGSAPDNTGGTVRTYNGGNATAVMGSDQGGGVVAAFKDGQAIAQLSAGANPSISLFTSSGTAVASLSYSSSKSGGNVTTRDNGGKGVFSAGAASDGGGEACVIRDGDKGYCLGIGLPLMGGGN